jgi:hypothetical protein
MRLQLAEAMAVGWKGRRSTSQDLVYSRWRSGVTLKRLSLRRPLASGSYRSRAGGPSFAISIVGHDTKWNGG